MRKKSLFFSVLFFLVWYNQEKLFLKVYIMRRRIPISDKFHQRLKLLRSEKELTQADFAHQLGIFMGRSKKLSVSAVSSWESGSKQPDFTIISSIASFYGVSIQYLTGETDSRTEDVSMKPLFLEDFIVEISVENLPLYDGKPVFLVFNSNKIKNCWGIYNADKETFSCRDQVYRNNASIRYFATDVVMDNLVKKDRRPLDLEEFIKLQIFWVEYHGSTSDINTRFSGFYQHTKTKSGIINSEGNILPYAGLHLYYEVYRDRYTK